MNLNLTLNLPFLRRFKRTKENVAAPVVAATSTTFAPEKPASERFGKTFVPNASRAIGAPSPLEFSLPGAAPTLPPPTQVAPAAAVATRTAVATPRTISLGGNSLPKLAPRPAEGLRTGLERTISLQLRDILPQLPPELLASPAPDLDRSVIFKAADVERGMSSGKPTVSLPVLYQQAPEIFAGPLKPDDTREIPLPFSKVLEQFASFRIRPDQLTEAAAPEVETAILKVTLEDSERFGTPVTPLQPEPAELPEMPDEPARELPAVTSPAAAPIRFAMPNPEQKPLEPKPTPALREQPAAATPPTLKLFPNGTGASAEKRVPASGAAPVPIPLPSPLAPAPARPEIPMPFKVAAPSDDLRLHSAASTVALPCQFQEGGQRIRLNLRSILRETPPLQFKGSPNDVPESAEIEVPISILQPQLSLGRIAISPAQFLTALPEECRHFFQPDSEALPVALPLQHVLERLPGDSLQIRGDQEEIQTPNGFETPFAQKAEEDAKRLKGVSGPVVRPAAAIPDEFPTSGEFADADDIVAEAVVANEEPAFAPPKPSAAPAVVRTPLQTELDTDEPVDAKAVVKHASRLPGVSACAIVFADGLSLAGNIPPEYEADALCATAPAVVRRIDDQMKGANLGGLNGVTVYCAKAPVSFFAHGNICLAALHSAGEIASEIRSRLSRIVKELAAVYSQPA